MIPLTKKLTKKSGAQVSCRREAHIPEHRTIPRGIITEPLNKSQRKFTQHIIHCQIRTGKDVPLPTKALKNSGMGHMTAQERKELIEVYGLFKRSGYIKGFEPIRYSMTPELEQRVFEAMTHPIRTGNFFDIDLIDLETDMPVPPRKSILKNEPRLTQRAFPKIVNQVNLYAIQDHFKELYDECIWQVGERVDYLRKKIMSNMQAYHALLVQELDDEDFTYTPAYKGCRTGRMYEIGGIQSMSRDFKKAAWESTGAINYDIRSCQIASMLEFDGLKDSTRKILTDYVDNPQSKYEYAARVGIDTDLWKQSLISLFFGANVWKGIYEGILDWDFGTYQHRAKELHEKLVEVAAPFIKAREDWFNVVRGIVSQTKFTRKGVTYIKNKLGKRTSELSKTGFLSAFLLQGIEARFIFTLIDLSSKYNLRFAHIQSGS